MAELNELVLVGCPGSEVTVCLVHGRGDGGGEDGVVACRAPTKIDLVHGRVSSPQN